MAGWMDGWLTDPRGTDPGKRPHAMGVGVCKVSYRLSVGPQAPRCPRRPPLWTCWGMFCESLGASREGGFLEKWLQGNWSLPKCHVSA